MSEQRRTVTTPGDLRGGTFERDGATTSLLEYHAHSIHDLRPYVTNIGSADTGVDIRIAAVHVSGNHCRIEQRPRGALLIDDGSKNGTYHEHKRTFGIGLKPLFEDTRIGATGDVLRPGTTFVVGNRQHRYIALDDAMREEHPALLDILGTEDEVCNSPESVSPSDLILAADSGGHMLITGEPGCEQESLARIVHKLSKRRHSPFVECDRIPDDWQSRSALLKKDADKATLLLNLGDSARPIDIGFVSGLFSSSYQIRVIALARTAAVAHEALSPAYASPMMHVELRPLAKRRAAIHRLLDRWLAKKGSPLRMSDLTAENQRALQMHDWRENLTKLRETAERLDAIIRAPESSLNQARKEFGIARNTFYSWYGSTLRLSLPLVPKERAKALRAAVFAQEWNTPAPRRK